jgi:hypothetical protein
MCTVKTRIVNGIKTKQSIFSSTEHVLRTRTLYVMFYFEVKNIPELYEIGHVR